MVSESIQRNVAARVRRLALVFEGVVLRVVAERRAQRGGAALVDRGVLRDGVFFRATSTRVARRTTTRHMRSLTATERDARNVGMNQYGSGVWVEKRHDARALTTNMRSRWTN